MAAQKKRPPVKGGGTAKSRAQRSKSAPRSRGVKTAVGSKSEEEFPTQVMGWSSTAGDDRRYMPIVEMPISGLITAADGASAHLAQAMVQANVEVAALVGRRSRACLDFPAHLSKCQTPQQMLAQHSQFIREMLHDYQAANDRIMKAWFEFGPRQ